ncbi:unnamed protein product [Tilletia controversa]|uniref:Peroxisomal membrane protein PEX16 n=3 Tax=Tilletia TaxID=13289 RepID=A0A8X7SWQ8_9BASI|nr:hypothetical protein CF336_g4589 [Tilletia laevis]KAE8197403.1 hypothetical protein CF328_g3856 [Tilletia controversa]KAE8260208.1 hypothetical protein A4X03_0g3884 [Tilletia caries]KAE8201112.1 hypothetical protein CF335_g3809 [Tilletia laevis]KAE8247268.1 hypothetical protein A4X06_0g4581 [Tilletia controversa]
MPSEKRERTELGGIAVEGSPLESVYVPATRKSGPAAPTPTIQLNTTQAPAGSGDNSGSSGKEKQVQKRSLVLLRKLEHELKVRRARNPRLSTTLSLLSEGEGRDALLSLTQNVLLAAHHVLSLPPPRRSIIPGYSYLRALSGLVFPSSSSSSAELSTRPKRPTKSVSTNTLRQIYLAQELLGSLKRCLLVGTWISDLALEAGNRLSSDSSDKGDGEAQGARGKDGNGQDDAGPNAPPSGLILDPPVSLTDVARLAQHGLALEGLLPLAGGSGPSSSSRSRSENKRLEAAGSSQAHASNTRPSDQSLPNTPASQDTNWNHNRDESDSATSSLPKTFKQRLLPFGQLQPALREGEDGIFAGQLGGAGGGEGISTTQAIPVGGTGGLEPGMTVESSWAMVQDHAEERRHLSTAAQSIVRGSKNSTIDDSAGLTLDDGELHVGRRRQDEMVRDTGEDEDEDADDQDEDQTSDVQQEVGPVAPYDPQSDKLLDTDSIDPADLSSPLPPIGTRSSSSAMDRWLSIWEGRLEALIFSAGTLADLADVLAFFSGTSVAWRWFRRSYMSRMAPHLSAYPSPLSAASGETLISRRQRQGLERTAVLLSALCGVLSLILVRIKRSRAKRRRREVARRFRAVMDGMEWREAMQARSLAARFASGQFISSSSPALLGTSTTDGTEDNDSADSSAAQLAKLTRAQRAFLTYDGALSTLTLHIRWLARERWATLAHSGFLFYEILRPGADKEGWEAWTGVLTSVVQVGRVWTGHFIGRSV